MDYLSLIGRSDVLFSPDISGNEEDLKKIIGRSRFLIIGGSGSIGQAVAREVFRRDPLVLLLRPLGVHWVPVICTLAHSSWYGFTCR